MKPKSAGTLQVIYLGQLETRGGESVLHEKLKSGGELELREESQEDVAIPAVLRFH